MARILVLTDVQVQEVFAEMAADYRFSVHADGSDGMDQPAYTVAETFLRLATHKIADQSDKCLPAHASVSD